MPWQVWVGWLVAVLVSFAVLEWWGWKRARTEGTFSWRVWQALFIDADRVLVGERPRRPRGPVYFVVLAPLVWLVVHFAFGGRFG